MTTSILDTLGNIDETTLIIVANVLHISAIFTLEYVRTFTLDSRFVFAILVQLVSLNSAGSIYVYEKTINDHQHFFLMFCSFDHFFFSFFQVFKKNKFDLYIFFFLLSFYRHHFVI